MAKPRQSKSRYILKKAMIIFGFLVILFILYKAVAVSRLYADRARFASYWQQQAKPKLPEKATIEYVALGDSAALGIGASSPEKSYVGLIAEELRSATGRPVRVTNLGVSGAKTLDLIEDQLPKFKKLKLGGDAVITLEIGANNVGPDFDERKFNREINLILDVVPPQTIVADVPYFGAGLHRKREMTVEKANLVIREAVKSHDLRLARLHDQTKFYGKWQDFAADYFHPSDHGYRNWSKAFLGVLKIDQ